jgi:RNHCP domain
VASGTATNQKGDAPMTSDQSGHALGPSGDVTRRFTRTVEDFTCEHCGQPVCGNGYTNHCPYCLHSKHVDINPGDRAADCGGLMEPIAAGVEDGQNFVVHRCQACGHMRRNKIAPKDEQAVVLRYFGRPIPIIPPSRR